jgi:hypothetical protein
MSRVSGLDAAQAMHDELPETAVVLLNNLDEEVLAQRGLSTHIPAIMTAEGTDASVPLEMPDLRAAGAEAGEIVFANVQPQPWKIAAPTASGFDEKALYIGGFVFFAGWAMILTMFLAQIGVFVVAAGALSMLAGFGVKLLKRGRRAGRKLTLPTGA